jgi:DNA-binding XRE family transcriptional regulator
MSDLQSFLDNALKNVKLEKTTYTDSAATYDIYHEIAELIIAARTEQGLTQEQLAQLTGVSQANISKFENENIRPGITTLNKIADGMVKRLVISFTDKESDE